MKTMTNNNYGKLNLVENGKRIKTADILKSYRETLRAGILQSKVDINGNIVNLTTSKTGNGGKRFWLVCPICNKRVDIIYQSGQNIIACRVCLKLKYRSQRYKGMLEADIG